MPRTPDDIYEELLAVRCRRGDQEAWSELVQRFTPRLLYYLRRFVGDVDERRTLLQDVWLKALRGVHSLRDERRLAAWLFAIAHRVTMNHYRDEYARQERSSTAALARHAASESDTADQFDNAELVHHALGRIGWIEREVLTLLFLEGMSVAEIAEVQRVPAGTVKSRLHRARAELRAVIESDASASRGES